MGHGNQRPEIELGQTFMPVLVTRNFDDDSIKNEWASMETPFSHYKSIGMTKLNLIEIGQQASEIFEFKTVKFHQSRTSNSKMSGLIWPKIELDRAFMPVLVTSNFDDDSIKNEWASMETPFSHYKYGKDFRCSRAANSVVIGPIWSKFRTCQRFYACPHYLQI